MAVKILVAEMGEETIPVEVVENPEFGNDGELKSVRDAYDRSIGAR